ncbi:MAG: DinB family protein [Candidatus Kariarchaeaceae archaeon]
MEISSIDSFIEYYERIRKRTIRVINCIPEDKLDWSSKPGDFTLGDIIRHIAGIQRFMFAENVKLKPSRYPGHDKSLADGLQQVVEYLNRLHEESMSLFKSLSDADLQEKCMTPGGVQITVWKWLRAMIEHEVHHRGQIYLMLNILGIDTPPLYGLTSEEVKERSKI